MTQPRLGFRGYLDHGIETESKRAGYARSRYPALPVGELSKKRLVNMVYPSSALLIIWWLALQYRSATDWVFCQTYAREDIDLFTNCIWVEVVYQPRSLDGRVLGDRPGNEADGGMKVLYIAGVTSRFR